MTTRNTVLRALVVGGLVASVAAAMAAGPRLAQADGASSAYPIPGNTPG